MMEKYKFDCLFLSFRLNSSPLNFSLRLVLQPALLPMTCHISALNKPPHVAGANLFRNPNPYRRNILPVTALKTVQRLQFRPAFRYISVLSCIIQTCASGETSARTPHGHAATAASHRKLQLPCQCQTHPPPPPFQEALSCKEIHCTIQKPFSSDHPKH